MALLLLPSFALAQQINFQGLTGNSTRNDVSKRFPEVVADRSLCLPSETVSRSADGVASCDTLKLNTYAVGDTDFEVIFLFSLRGKLSQVILTYIWPGYPQPDPNYDEIFSKFLELKSLLIVKYGQPLGFLECTRSITPSSKFLNLCSTWQGRKSGEFDPSLGLINLDTMATKKTDADKTYRLPSLSIAYHLVPTKDAGGL